MANLLLKEKEIDAEVINARFLKPLDEKIIHRKLYQVLNSLNLLS